MLTAELCTVQAFTEKSMDFQVKIIERSGLGDDTYLPEGENALLLQPGHIVTGPWHSSLSHHIYQFHCHRDELPGLCRP